MKTVSIKEKAEKICNSKKYRHMDPETVRDILEQEFTKFSNKKQALESARTKIHQVWADYLGSPPIKKLKAKLSDAFGANSSEAVKKTCMEIKQLCFAS